MGNHIGLYGWTDPRQSSTHFDHCFCLLDVEAARRLEERSTSAFEMEDLSLFKKMYGVALVGYFVFVLYSDIWNMITILNGSGLPSSTLLENATLRSGCQP